MTETTTATITGAAASCGYCGMIHGAKCPSVKAFEYHPDGTVKRVEFFSPNDYAPKLGWGTDPNPRMWPDGITPGTYGPVYAFTDARAPMRWTDTEGWQRVDGGAVFPPFP